MSPALAALDADAPGLDAALAQLRREDALGELLERRGRAAELGAEAGDVKLSWVDQVAWTLDHTGGTVLRGGSGILFSPHLPATVRQSAGDPLVPFRTTWPRTDAAARGLKWPMYTVDLRPVAQSDGGGRPAVFSIFDTNLPNPSTVQTMISLQRSIGSSIVTDVGYVRTDGRDFPLQRLLSMVIDRQTGARPAAWTLGSPGGYYVDSSQSTTYNGLQTSVRRRSSDFQWEFNYTLSKGTATQGGDLQAYYLATDVANIQDFFNPEADRTVVNGDISTTGASTTVTGFHDNVGDI